MNMQVKFGRYLFYARLIIFVAFCVPRLAIAQLDSLPNRNETAVLLKSRILSEDRSIWVHLPANYNNTTDTYPVMYLLDGEGNFNYASEMVNFLAGYDRNRIPDMIVVAIVNVNRGRDFTPIYLKNADGSSDTNKVISTEGAGKFLKYITDEVLPYIDTHYRVQPYRILAGHSLGGLFALYAKETKPELFPATILISPAISVVHDHMINNISSFLTGSHLHNGKLFFSIGNENTQKVDLLAVKLKQSAPIWFNWYYKEYEDENHFSVPYKSLFDGLKFIYKDWFIDYYGNSSLSYQDIVRHFNTLSVEFGYEINPTEDFLNNCGYNQLRSGHLGNATEIFVENVKKHPKSSNAYDSLAEAYMKSGSTALAILNYKRSIELNPNNNNGKEMLQKLEGANK